MSQIILIISCILLPLVVLHLVLKRFNVFQKASKKMSVNTFMTTGQLMNMITSKIELTDEEKDHLEVLFTVFSSSRLRYAFEVEEEGMKWFLNTRKAVFHSDQFDDATREDIEFFLYEIHRKINNFRMMAHPDVKSINDISLGQGVDIHLADGTTYTGELIDKGITNITINIAKKHVSSAIDNHKLIKKRVKITFWKKMDARYSFVSTVKSVSTKRGGYALTLTMPKKIKCIQIRSYPRYDVEIPMKFRQATLSADEDTGALQETYGAVVLGIINNIGPNGCKIITHSSTPVDTVIMMEYPLFHQIIYTKGIVKNVSRYGDVYTLHIEFSTEVQKFSILQIYHYIYANKNTGQEEIIGDV